MKYIKNRSKSKYRISFILILLIIAMLIIYSLSTYINSNNSKQASVSKYPNAVQVELASNEDQVVLEKQNEGPFDLSYFIENEEFRMSNSSQLIFYIVSTQENRYDVRAIAYDIHRADNFELEVVQDTNDIYFLMPEFATVHAATQSISKNVSELEVIDGRESIKELQAGGGLKFRIFKSSKNEEESNKFEFNLMSLNESMKIDSKSIVYGKYIITISKHWTVDLWKLRIKAKEGHNWSSTYPVDFGGGIMSDDEILEKFLKIKNRQYIGNRIFIVIAILIIILGFCNPHHDNALYSYVKYALFADWIGYILFTLFNYRCPRCGANVEQDSYLKYCRKCGARVEI